MKLRGFLDFASFLCLGPVSVVTPRFGGARSHQVRPIGREPMVPSPPSYAVLPVPEPAFVCGEGLRKVVAPLRPLEHCSSEISRWGRSRRTV